MAVRIASSELSRKGVRYRATENGQFTLTASARIPAGRSIVINEFLDLFVLAPGVDLHAIQINASAAIEDSGTAVTLRPRVYDYLTAVASNHATGLDATNLAPTASAAFQSGAAGTLGYRAERSGAVNGAGVFQWTPAAVTSWDPVTGTVTTNFNVTIPNPSPRAYPLTQARIPAVTGTRLIRLCFDAAPGVQTVAAATNRVFTATITCSASSVNVAQQPPYTYSDRRDSSLISAAT